MKKRGRKKDKTEVITSPTRKAPEIRGFSQDK
jgi:hypothetical protein